MSIIIYFKKAYSPLFEIAAISYYYIVLSNKLFPCKPYIYIEKDKKKYFKNHSSLF